MLVFTDKGLGACSHGVIMSTRLGTPVLCLLSTTAGCRVIWSLSGRDVVEKFPPLYRPKRSDNYCSLRDPGISHFAWRGGWMS